jgi:hypothetical protein
VTVPGCCSSVLLGALSPIFAADAITHPSSLAVAIVLSVGAFPMYWRVGILIYRLNEVRREDCLSRRSPSSSSPTKKWTEAEEKMNLCDWIHWCLLYLRTIWIGI